MPPPPIPARPLSYRRSAGPLDEAQPTAIAASPTLSPEEEKRRFAETEILTSERTYVASLTLLSTVFAKPLMENAKGPKEHAVCTVDDVYVLFSNLDAIIFFNQQLLGALEDKESNNVSTVGRIFVDLGPYLKVYATYVNGYSRASELHFAMLELKNKKYANFLQAATEANAEALRGRSMTDLSIQPVQRVPRYRLLLEELLKRTPPDDPDYEWLERGLARISDVATVINERLRDFENTQKVMALQRQFGCSTLVEPHRRFVREATMSRMTRRGLKETRFVLFNDLLIYGVRNVLHDAVMSVGGIEVASSPASVSATPGQSYTLKRQLELVTMKVSECKDDPLSFEVKTLEKSFIVTADTAETRDEWFQLLSTNIAANLASEEGQKSPNSRRQSTANASVFDEEHAPVWVPDSQANSCHVCDAKFTMIRLRRHHCRKCGNIVCDPCSAHRWKLPHVHKTIPQRICSDCYLAIRKELEDTDYASAGSGMHPAAPPTTANTPAPTVKRSGSIFSKVASFSTKSMTSTGSSRALQVSLAGSSSSTSSTSSAPPASLPELPPKWKALVDPQGRTYYWYLVTNEVTWVRPTLGASPEPSSDVKSALGSASKSGKSVTFASPTTAPTSPPVTAVPSTAAPPPVTAVPSTAAPPPLATKPASESSAMTSASTASSSPMRSTSGAGVAVANTMMKRANPAPAMPAFKQPTSTASTRSGNFSESKTSGGFVGSAPATSESAAPAFSSTSAAANARLVKRVSASALSGPSLRERLAMYAEAGKFDAPPKVSQPSSSLHESVSGGSFRAASSGGGSSFKAPAAPAKPAASAGGLGGASKPAAPPPAATSTSPVGAQRSKFSFMGNAIKPAGPVSSPVLTSAKTPAPGLLGPASPLKKSIFSGASAAAPPPAAEASSSIERPRSLSIAERSKAFTQGGQSSNTTGPKPTTTTSAFAFGGTSAFGKPSGGGGTARPDVASLERRRRMPGRGVTDEKPPAPAPATTAPPVAMNAAGARRRAEDLPPIEFIRIFGKTQMEFAKMPGWMQVEQKTKFNMM